MFAARRKGQIRVEDAASVDVVAPNFKRRLSGVTSTIIQLVPLQARLLAIAALGPGLPGHVPHLTAWQVPRLFSRPRNRPFRIWHARRNNEMIAGILMRDVLRMPLRLVFTSAAQRNHHALTKWLIRRVDAVIATSRGSGAYLEVPHSVVMHGVDTERFRPAQSEDDDFAAAGLPGRYAVGCFGRIRAQKGTDLFVEAMIALLPEFPEWTAVITGRTTPEHRSFADALKRRVAEAGLKDRIVFLGEVPSVDAWYRRISLYVAPSRNEGFGLTPLEAMASGTPAVTSDAGAYAEMVVPGETGAVVPAGDGATLMAAIRPYFADPASCALQGEKARAHVVEHFALEREVAGISAIYDGLWARG